MKRDKLGTSKDRKLKKVKPDALQDFVKSFGYEILSTNHNTTRTKLEFKCPQKHTFRMTYADFKQGKRCPVCAIESKKDLKKFTTDKIQDLFSKEGYVLKSTEYIDSQQPLEITCSEGHESQITLYEFKKGVRCKICTKEAKGQEIDQDKIKSYVGNQNYTLVTKKVANLNSKVVFKCDNNHKSLISFNNFKNGERCMECTKESDTPESLKAKLILKQITGKNFTREVIENNKAGKMIQPKYDGYCKDLKVIFEISEVRDLNKLVFCRLNGMMYLGIGKDEINQTDITEKLIDLGIIK